MLTRYLDKRFLLCLKRNFYSSENWLNNFYTVFFVGMWKQGWGISCFKPKRWHHWSSNPQPAIERTLYNKWRTTPTAKSIGRSCVRTPKSVETCEYVFLKKRKCIKSIINHKFYHVPWCKCVLITHIYIHNIYFLLHFYSYSSNLKKKASFSASFSILFESTPSFPFVFNTYF